MGLVVRNLSGGTPVPLYTQQPKQIQSHPLYVAPVTRNLGVGNPQPSTEMPLSPTRMPQKPAGIRQLTLQAPHGGFDMQQGEGFDQQQEQPGVTYHSLQYLAGGRQAPSPISAAAFDKYMASLTPAQVRASLGTDRPLSEVWQQPKSSPNWKRPVHQYNRDGTVSFNTR